MIVSGTVNAPRVLTTLIGTEFDKTSCRGVNGFIAFSSPGTLTCTAVVASWPHAGMRHSDCSKASSWSKYYDAARDWEDRQKERKNTAENPTRPLGYEQDKTT